MVRQSSKISVTLLKIEPDFLYYEIQIESKNVPVCYFNNNKNIKKENPSLSK